MDLPVQRRLATRTLQARALVLRGSLRIALALPSLHLPQPLHVRLAVCVERPEDPRHLADEVVHRHEAERRQHAAVGGVVAVVAEHEEVARRHRERAVMDLPTSNLVMRLRKIGARAIPAP